MNIALFCVRKGLPGRFYCIGKAMQEVAFAGKDFNRAYFGRNRRNCILAGAGKASGYAGLI